MQTAADAVKPGMVLYSEGMAIPKDMPGIISGRVHNALYYPPILNLNKFIRPDFAIFRDNGLFGTEDMEEIAPAIEAAKQLGYDVEGPVPPDTMFAKAAQGAYGGVVAMYHDQGHIPFKLAGFKWNAEKQRMDSVKGVNITLGLPIIRTSVDHGTAFEIAGKGIASPDAMILAIESAVQLAKYKQ